MGGAEDEVEGFWGPAAACSRVALERTQSGGADLCLSRAALRHNEGNIAVVQLPLHSLRHSELGVIEGVSGLLLYIAVDGQHLIRQRL